MYVCIGKSRNFLGLIFKQMQKNVQYNPLPVRGSTNLKNKHKAPKEQMNDF
jgi:hypothetical protein